MPDTLTPEQRMVRALLGLPSVPEIPPALEAPSVPEIPMSALEEFPLFNWDGYTGAGKIKADLGSATGEVTLASPDSDLGLSISRNLDFDGRDRRITDTAKGRVGLVDGFYSQSDAEGSQSRAFGAGLNVGPGRINANRSEYSQDVIDGKNAPYFSNPRVDNRIDRIGASGSFPMLGGDISGEIEREYVKRQLPQHNTQASRPVVKGPTSTTYGLGWKGGVGPGQLNFRGDVRDVRNVGTDLSVGGSYNWPNPLGLGGSLSAEGSWRNPIGDESAADAWLRYQLNF